MSSQEQDICRKEYIHKLYIFKCKKACCKGCLGETLQNSGHGNELAYCCECFAEIKQQIQGIKSYTVTLNII